MICCCCQKKERKRDKRTDEWQGRLDGYCTDCASMRCDREAELSRLRDMFNKGLRGL